MHVLLWYGTGDGDTQGPMEARVEHQCDDGLCRVAVLDAEHLEWVGFGPEDNPEGEPYLVWARFYPPDGFLVYDDYGWRPCPSE